MEWQERSILGVRVVSDPNLGQTVRVWRVVDPGLLFDLSDFVTRPAVWEVAAGKKCNILHAGEEGEEGGWQKMVINHRRGRGVGAARSCFSRISLLKR